MQQNIVSPKIERLKLPNECGLIFVGTKKQGYILAISSPPLGEFLSQLKNREKFEGGLEKRNGKGGEKEKKEE